MTYRSVYREYWPAPEDRVAIPLSLNAADVLDATGEKYAWCGRVAWANDGITTKSVTKVWFRFATVTKAGGSAMTLSLQDVSTTTGQPIQPDETQDQTVAIANADAGFASNTNYQSGAFSASRSVNKGDMLAVVLEFDGAGRLGADSIGIQCPNRFGGNSGSLPLEGGAVIKTGGTWALVTRTALIVLEFTDGTFGTVEDGVVYVGSDGAGFNSGSTPDEKGAEFTVPEAIKIDGFWMALLVAGSSSDFDVVLYNGTSAIATASVDATRMSSTGPWAMAEAPLATEAELLPGNTYRLMLKPTTANNVNLYSLDVANENHLQAVGNAGNWLFTSRTDAGAFDAVTTTRRPLMGLRISGRAKRAAQLVNSGGLVG